MPNPITLSKSAVAVLRFRIKGYKFPAARDMDRDAFGELVAAGLMEPDGAGDYRFTEEHGARREEILCTEEDRIEREQWEPPDADHLSEAARELLRYRLATHDAKVTPDNLEAYRELVRARIMYPVSGFIGGPESSFRFTYWGYHRRDEWTATPSGSS